MGQRQPIPEHRSATETVVHAVADAEDTSPFDLPPLATAIDPDALSGLLAEDKTHVDINFAYYKYQVSVVGDEQIVLLEDLTDKRKT